MNQEERKLIRAMQSGDRQAFDTLYGRYAGRVFAFTLQLSGSRADAEDLTQEAFVAAFQGIGRFQGQSSLFSWLLGIAIRRRRDAQRRKPDPPFEPPEPDTGQADRAIAAIVLADAIRSLPEPLREAFLLVASQGLTHKEAAAQLEEPLGTVKWRVAEASRRLRALMQDDPKTTAPPETETAKTSAKINKEQEFPHAAAA